MKLILLLWIVVGLSVCYTPADKPVVEKEMKEISYRGGLVTFSIPYHWKEEYMEDGGAAFYADGEDSGTLRLNVLSFTSEEAKPVDVGAEARSMATKHNGEVTVLRDGSMMARYDQRDTEKGQPITLRFWCVYNRIDDSHMRLVVFSYTLPTAQVMDEKHVRKMEMIERAIRDARFAKVAGALQ